MKKWDFVKVVAEKSGLTQKDVDNVLTTMTDVIVTECRDNGDSVNLPNLGMFKQKVNAAHKGRNPKTGEIVDINGSKTIAFRASSNVKIVEEVKKKKK